MFALILSLIIMQPQGQIIWSHVGTGGIYSSIPTFDYNNDGHPDVAASVYYGATTTPPIKLFLVSGLNGSDIWTRTDVLGIWGNRGLSTINDISGDGVPDLIMGTPGGIYPGRTVFAINGVTGATIWSHSYYPTTGTAVAGWVYCVRPTVDINHDGYPEVLASVGTTTNYTGVAACFSGHTGDSIWAFRPNDAGMCITPHVDLNSDTVPEVILAAGGNSADNHIYCLNGRTGTQMWSYLTSNSVEYVASVDDANNNGTKDVVGGGWAYTVYCVDGTNGNLIWQNNLGTGRVIMTLVPIRDINGDGIRDIVVGSWSSLVTVLSGQTGAVLWSQTVGSDCWSVDTVSDLTGDGIPEVVGGAVNGRDVKVMNGATGEVLWYYNFVDRVYDVTGAPDLDGDGHPDVLVSLQDQNGQPYQFYAFKGLPSGIEENSNTVINNTPITVVHQNHSTLIKLSIPQGKSFSYQLYDINGRILETSPICSPNGDNTIISMTKTSKPSGIYFVRVNIEGEQSETVKISLF
jgi:outer membrane protein assembly factor BamB